jgi:hypothetical protein
MDQLSFASLDFAAKKKRTKREVFLAEMAAVVPWGRARGSDRVALSEDGAAGRPSAVSSCGHAAHLLPAAVVHVWTTPALQEDSDVQLAVGCKSCVRPNWCGATTAGPDVVRGSGPNQPGGQLAHVPLRVFPIDGSTVRITPSSPSQFGMRP